MMQTEKLLPKYPVYIISKGRSDACLTAKFFVDDNCPFKLVVEPQEFEAYSKEFGADCLLKLPFSNLGLGSIPARNWVWEHSLKNGHARHWILDDNIRQIYQRVKARRIPCRAGRALHITEKFVDKYENIGIGGLNYAMFVPDFQKAKPFVRNVHVYSCLLIDNNLPVRWRGRYNEDTDLCLQVLSLGLCTVLVNAFCIQKMRTMKMKGGNTDSLYQGDGRLKMAKSLQRAWPKVVEVDRRFQRPQHVVHDSWKCFDTELKLKKTEIDTLQETNYETNIQAIKPVKSEAMKQLLSDFTNKT